MHPILLAIIASICYGLSGPIAKLGYNRGMLTDGFLIPYGVGLILFSSISVAQRGFGGIYPNPTALLFGLLAGSLCAIGFKTSGIALSTPGVSVSVIMMILTAHGLLASGISIPLFREYEQINLWKFALGAILVVIGVVLVTTSTTSSAKE